jgi:hypothetical protein
MDHAEDVERLFSWLKAPMVHYRDFAPRIEVAEAMATWPIVHKAAVQTGIAAEEEPAPHGDVAARERIARERMTMPAVAPAIPESPPPGTAAAATGEPAPAELAPAELAPAGLGSEPELQPLPRETVASEGTPAARHHPSPERGALFGGEYRGVEREAQPSRVADRHERSLDAVFARLSGTPERLPDPRSRARTTPRLGAFFGRVR